MKRSKLILGGIGVVAILSTALIVSNSLSNKGDAQYSQDRGSLSAQAGANGYKEWLKGTMIDIETGEEIESSKLKSVLKSYSLNQTKALSVEWTEHGPDNIGGRTRAILIDHTNENVIWAGSVSGGLYKSTNKADKWERVENYPGSQFISSIAQDAGGNIYVATGSNFDKWNGDGLYVTPDKGETWQIVPGTGSFNKVSRVAATKYSSVVYFTHSSKLKKYTFGGTVEDVTSYGGPGSQTLAYSSDGKAIVVASTNNQTWFSSDWGNTFDKVSVNSSNVTTGKIAELGYSYVEYAISKKKADGTYSIYAATTSSNNQGQWISLDNGANWHRHTAATGPDINNGVIDYRDQGGYNSVVSFDPTDVNRVIIGGIDLHEWKKQINNPPAGGWSKISVWFASPTSSMYVHADNHELKWDSNNRLYIGNDGGIGVSLDKGSTFYHANRGYNVTQFYAIGHDRNGSVAGGTQDNGTLYNDHKNGTYQEFRSIGGGDGFTTEISFFNPKVIFTSVYYNLMKRSMDGGVSSSPFTPALPSNYSAIGVQGDHPFHTQFHLAEFYDTSSEDSVIYIPRKKYGAGDVVRVPSRATGDTIEYETPVALHFDDTLIFNPTLTETEYEVKDSITGNTFDLGFINFTAFASASGNTPPIIGDSLLVFLMTVPDTIVVASVTPYDFHYGSNSSGPGKIPFGRDTMKLGIPWDTITVQDPFQSWFVFGVDKNGGEVWGTRQATQFSTSNPKWVRLISGIGGYAQDLDVAFSKDLNHMFVTAGASIHRLSGLGSVYASDPDFKTKLSFNPGNNTGATATTKTVVRNGSFRGIGINPNNPDDLVAVQVFGGSAHRSSNATSASPSMPSVGSQGGIAFYDVIIDRDDSNILFASTFVGVSMSENGGATWTDVSSPLFEGVPAYRLRQAWRTFDEGNNVPGEVFVGTHGRGIWSTDAVLNVVESDPLIKKEKAKAFSLEVYPNPARYNSTLIVDMKESKALDIQFYNISGRLVKRIRKTDAHVGRNEVGFSVSELPQGTYLIRVQSGNQIENTKFVKM